MFHAQNATLFHVWHKEKNEYNFSDYRNNDVKIPILEVTIMQKMYAMRNWRTYSENIMQDTWLCVMSYEKGATARWRAVFKHFYCIWTGIHKSVDLHTNCIFRLRNGNLNGKNMGFLCFPEMPHRLATIRPLN